MLTQLTYGAWVDVSKIVTVTINGVRPGPDGPSEVINIAFDDSKNNICLRGDSKAILDIINNAQKQP